MFSFPSFLRFARFALSTLGLAGVVLLPSCRKRDATEPATAGGAKIKSAEPLRNELGGNPSTFLADQAGAPIHWQPWKKETFDLAKRSDRLVLAVFAMPQQGGAGRVLDAIYKDKTLVDDINNRFVPALVDSDACRETGLIGTVLCRENRMPFSFPLLVLLTAEGNPVGWASVGNPNENPAAVFKRSGFIVDKMWRENPGYIESNSAQNNADRVQRMAKEALLPAISKDPAVDMLRGVRQLASYYDAGAGTFDSAGSLIPSGSLEVLADAAVLNGLPAEDAARAEEAARGLSRILSTSPMVDPLDGGIFSIRCGRSWTFPMPSRDCQNHARAIVALAAACRVSGDPLLREQVRAALTFAEKTYAAPGGVFALGRQDPGAAGNRLWSLEELGRILSPEELKIWSVVSDLESIGNISLESDPARRQMGRNALAVKVAPETAAAETGMTPEAARAAFESGRRKLLEARRMRHADVEPDIRPHAASTFRMASAYASAAAATGDAVWRNKAVETLAKARAAFASGTNIQFFAGEDDPASTGRAFLYGLAIQAALDVYDVSLDPEAKTWALDLSVTATERFMKDAALREATEPQSLVPVPVSDRTMLYDDSSAGLFSAAEARLGKLGIPVPPVYGTAVASLPLDAVERPFAHTDLLLASLIRQKGPCVVLSPDAPTALKQAVLELPLRLVARRTADAGDDVPAGKARIDSADGRHRVAATAEEMKAAVILAGSSRR